MFSFPPFLAHSLHPFLPASDVFPSGRTIDSVMAVFLAVYEIPKMMGGSLHEKSNSVDDIDGLAAC